MLNVLLCIESRIYREGLTQLLNTHQEFAAVKACSTLDEVADLMSCHDFSVLLLDVSNCRDAQYRDQTVHSAFNQAGHCPVVVAGLDDDDREILASLEAGAAGCVTRDQSFEEMVAIFQAADRKELLCTPKVTRRLQERLCMMSRIRQQVDLVGRLSRQEQSVAGFLERAMSNKQIARELGLEVSTVKNHVHNILLKLRVTNRSEAAALIRACSVTHSPEMAAAEPSAFS